MNATARTTTVSATPGTVYELRGVTIASFLGAAYGCEHPLELQVFLSVAGDPVTFKMAFDQKTVRGETGSGLQVLAHGILEGPRPLDGAKVKLFVNLDETASGFGTGTIEILV